MKKEPLEMILEDFSGKFDLVLEGQESLRKEMHGIRGELSEKIEDNSFKVDILNKKMDAVDAKLSKKIDGAAAKLQSHRADTEVNRDYQDREE